MSGRIEDDPGLSSALRRLPKREPSSGIWRRIEATLVERDAMASIDRPAASRALMFTRYGLAAVVAAVVVTAAVVLAARFDRSDAPDALRQITAAPEDPDSSNGTQNLANLVAESERLERALVALPRYNGVVRVGTASTISGLEDHIAWLDAELSESAAADADPSYTETLWRERVEVMNALVDVQYAQLPARVLVP